MSGSMPAAPCRWGRRAPAPSPGPVCYDAGGEVPTITDANVILGYLNPRHLVGGALKLNAEKARQVFADQDRRAARPRLEAAAYRRARDRRLQHDPRHQGGVDRARPRPARVRAVRLRRQRPAVRLRHGARRSASRRVDRAAGAGSVLLVRAALCRRGASLCAHLPPAAAAGRPGRDRRRLGATWRARRRRSSRSRASRGERARLRRSARAALQGAELRAGRAGAGRADRCRAWSRISRRPSAREHEKTYGHRAGPEEPVELVAIQVVGQGLREGRACRERVAAEPLRAASPARRAAPISAPTHGWIETPILERSDLATRRAGRSSSRNTTPPASSRPARRPSSTAPATS